MIRGFLGLMIVVAMIAWLHQHTIDPSSEAPPLALSGVLGQAPEEFLRVMEPVSFEFPKDHAMHPDYRTEWWYFTGRLDADDRPLGFQFTLFRFGLGQPTDNANKDTSAWRSEHLWMAHLALSDGLGSDSTEGQFYQHERFARDGLGLAGATENQWWLKNWTVTANDEGWLLDAMAQDFGVRLQLTPTRPITLQGERGFSQKGPEPGNASYYYSLTRLAAQGEVVIDDQPPLSVQGLAWLDREWGSGQLSDTQSGWDWFAIHLDSGHDLMVYRLRNLDHSMSEFSKGMWVSPEGESTVLHAHDFELIPTRYWEDAQGDRWPLEWQLKVPSQHLDLIVKPLFDDQRWYQSVAYWEGAIDVFDATGDENTPAPVGRGYLELSGYAASETLDRRASQTTPPQDD